MSVSDRLMGTALRIAQPGEPDGGEQGEGAEVDADSEEELGAGALQPKVA
ncbi:MAG TPA: hypothetical protein VGP82_06475 [Ktedonobacterales bacterium]|jgi:hypothetical protein|nr:hypothetical protein [Ktedonobacterales bacterium]